jgi:hypothetical protein
MHRMRVTSVLIIALLFAIGAEACRTEKPRPASVSPARSASSVEGSSPPDSRVRAPVETVTQGNEPLSENAWARADKQTRRLPPSTFADLPSTVAGELQRLGCTIPQTDWTVEPHNVITGRFLSAANRDWAVLCSRDRVSAVLVFPNGAIDGMREVESSPDAQWLQGMGGNQIGFSRAIAVANPRYIISHYQEYGGLKPPPLDHDGINDIFVEKESSVLYWHQGNWLRLQGAD